MKVRPKPPVSELENASWGTGEEEHDIFDELSNRDFVVVTWCNSIFYSTSGHKVPPLMYWSDQRRTVRAPYVSEVEVAKAIEKRQTNACVMGGIQARWECPPPELQALLTQNAHRFVSFFPLHCASLRIINLHNVAQIARANGGLPGRLGRAATRTRSVDSSPNCGRS